MPLLNVPYENRSLTKPTLLPFPLIYALLRLSKLSSGQGKVKEIKGGGTGEKGNTPKQRILGPSPRLT